MLIKYILTQKKPLFKHFCVLNGNVFHILFLTEQREETDMKKLAVICALVLCAGLLFGCVNSAQKAVYISGDIECEVSFTLDKSTYRALVERRDGYTRICFLEPSSLSGIELTRNAEGMSATLDGMEINDGIERLFEIERFFEYDTVVLSSELDGDVERLALERASGEKFYLYLVDGTPVRIEGELCGERREIVLIRIDGEMLRR